MSFKNTVHSLTSCLLNKAFVPRNWASIVYGFLIRTSGQGIIPDVPRLRDKASPGRKRCLSVSPQRCEEDTAKFPGGWYRQSVDGLRKDKTRSFVQMWMVF